MEENPILTVVRGNPTAEELAAVVAVLTARAAAAAAAVAEPVVPAGPVTGRPRSAWNAEPAWSAGTIWDACSAWSVWAAWNAGSAALLRPCGPSPRPRAPHSAKSPSGPPVAS